MQRYKAEIEYNGKKYAGMQRQSGVQQDIKTVQGVIESALLKFTGGRHSTIDYCGRTDAGVHAFAQVIHFDVESTLPEINILRGINFFLSKSSEKVVLKNIEKVPQEFHSRFSCLGREYKYYIYNGEVRSPIFDGLMHHVSTKLDISIMQDSANILIGTHDFSSFRGRGCQAQSPIKTVDFIKIIQLPQNIVEIHIGARSFLYHMVRNITGALIYAGIGKIKKDSVCEILEKMDVSFLPYTAPACGLYFFKAHY